SFFIAYLIKRSNEAFGLFKRWLTVAAISGAFFFLTRYREAGHLALVTLFEITFFYAWVISIFYVVFIKRDISLFIQSVTLSFICAILIWNAFMDRTTHTLNPLLDSFWLGIHVPAAILGYGAFLLSFVVSMYYVYAERKERPLGRLASLNTGLIMGGVMLLTACIITGAIWAKSAWGRFWSWDPKETWALVTFVIYASGVAVREVFKLNPRCQAYFSILGFMAMLFTFFGVGLFLTSHHAYQ
ncbi:MAG: cytochrome c biogenesis protein CcsA, partial [Candidatus Omnitrophota bacterium]